MKNSRWLGVLICLVVSLLFNLDGALSREWRDALQSFRLFAEGKVYFHEPVIIKIDERSLRALGAWPWPRDVYADLLSVLSRERPAAVGLDILFQEPSNQESDARLRAALTKAGFPVVIGAELDLRAEQSFFSRRLKFSGKKPALFPEAMHGYLNFPLDVDGVIRRWYWQPGAVPPLALALAKKVEPGVWQERNGALFRAGTKVLAQPGAIPISFRGTLDSFPQISFADVLQSRFPKGFFRNKVVLVGTTGATSDRHLIACRNLGYVSGVYIQAEVYRNLRRNRFLRIPPFWCLLAPLSALAVAGGFFLQSKRSWLVKFLVTGSFLMLVIFLACLLIFSDYALNVVPFGVLSSTEFLYFFYLSWRDGQQEKNRLLQTLSRYLSPQAAAEILRQGASLPMDGERRFVLVIFADIRGFTGYSEGEQPERVVQVLNYYLDRMANIVFREGGMIDKFLGDGLLAVFGIPFWTEDCWLKAWKVCRELSLIKPEGDKPGFLVGIGLAWGEVVAGSVGNVTRSDYTVIGSPVNLASRLEKLSGPGEVVLPVPENTPLERFIPEGSVEEVQLKGLKKPLRILRVCPGGKEDLQ